MNSTAAPRKHLTMGQAGTDLQHITITRYTTAAGMVVLIYDSLLTSSDEVRAAHTWTWQILILFVAYQVRLVWPRSLTVAKLLYYVIRYVSIVGLVASNYRTSI